MGAKHLWTMEYPTKDEWTSRAVYKAMVTGPRQYVADHQQDRDIYVQPFRYAYNIQGHPSTYVVPSRLVRSRLPPGTTKFGSPTALLTDIEANQSMHVSRTSLCNWQSTKRQGASKVVRTAKHRTGATMIETFPMHHCRSQLDNVSTPINEPLLPVMQNNWRLRRKKSEALGLGSFEIVLVSPNLLTVDKDRIQNSLWINWALMSLEPKSGKFHDKQVLATTLMN